MVPQWLTLTTECRKDGRRDGWRESWEMGNGEPKMAARNRWWGCLGQQPAAGGGGTGAAKQVNMTQVSALGNWLGGEYRSQAFGGHTQCPPLRGPESWLAEGVMASPGSALLKLTPSGLWTEPLCSCLTKMSKEPLEGEGSGSTSAPNVLVLSTPGASGN